MDIKKKIEEFISDNYFQDIINSEEFYFSKLLELFHEYKIFDIGDFKNDLEQFVVNIPLEFKFQELLDKTNNKRFNEFLTLIGKLISIFDEKGYNSKEWNTYADKRCVSRAQFTQKNWTYCLFKYKLNNFNFLDIDQNKYRTFRYAIEFIENPEIKVNITSQNHRGQICKFFNLSNESDLILLFNEFTSLVKNKANKGVLIAGILYTKEIKVLWLDSVIGLMASDNTGWQEDQIQRMKGFTAAMLWNSKRPSGTDKTLKFLKNIVEEGNTFNLFYSSGGFVNYKATIIDFAENQEDLDSKDWINNYKILDYSSNFSDYADDNKVANIVFLAKTLEKINPIPVSSFSFYGDYNVPRQDNLSPLKAEPNHIENSNLYTEPKKMNHLLNQILYGPPGTGKTFNTINKALEIIGESIEGKTRKEIKDIFDEKRNDGQIVFTTFHQSMSYEDFIEGIKPDSSGEKSILKYKIEDGVFKRACAIAGYNCYKIFKSKQPTNVSNFSYDNLYDSFVDFIQTKIKENDPPVYKTLREKDVVIKNINKNDSIIAVGIESKAKTNPPITRENLQKLYDKYKSIDEIKDQKQIKEVVQVTTKTTEFYAVFSGLKEFEKSYKPDLDETEDLEFSEICKKFNAEVFDEAIKLHSKEANPVILIIDEINRGNVSQIFGELITLIEEDKRIGNKEALKITLPYSKEPFSVPANLYIIGTMNTADRSVEALDTALRRRFHFIEMPPQPELIATEGKLKEEKGVLENIDLPQLLTTINKRIEKLLDKDHQIGHSYFMNVSSPDELKSAFQNKIIPLLQEYFFGDYGKIGLVLGEGFFEIEDESKEKSIFAKFQDYDSTDFSERKVYKLKNVYEMDDVENDHTNFMTAINALIGK